MRKSKLANYLRPVLAILTVLALLFGAASVGVALQRFSSAFPETLSLSSHPTRPRPSDRAKASAPITEIHGLSEYLVIGDSNTVRMSTLDTALCEAKNIAAVSGAGASNWRTRTDASSTIGGQSIFEYLEALDDADFAYVLVLLGTNDYRLSEDDFAEAYADLLDYLRGRNHEADIVLGTPLRVNDDCSPTITDDNAGEVAEYIRTIAQVRGLRVLDLYAYMGTDDMSASRGDGYHLSEDGAAKAANYIKGWLN